ncbi:sulfurtransferase [Geobacter sp. SVR]|uniref:sulfurtransferase n=1 Tax=Geobacter sp. SVR TaxID=2495594 RepID=UPI00143EFEBA|nr:rhodanese-like domain-containing protein [Geobacter sp. SVR]BCS54137.1 sulfurtransferase [Geobacter sp. SVR]GCF87699.1 sulfurtransferase [Geobacter sp. SVR]
MKATLIRQALLCILLTTTMVSGATAGQTDYKGYPRGSALIDVHELKRLVDARDSKLVILAAENSLEYRLGHIPGAFQVDRPAIEAPAETQDGVSGNIIAADSFTKLARQLGIDQDSTVVVYDSKYDATRLWWAFDYYGKGDVRVLDGGIKAWRAAGYPVDLLAPPLPARPGSFAARIVSPRLRVDTPEIAGLHANPSAQLWDTRDLKEFTGDELKKGAYRAGRIPGSRHSSWELLKRPENQSEWVDAATLNNLLSRLGFDPSKDQYFYCQSGVRSTQALFALYLAGWPVERLHNYDSSWIGWSKDTRLPIASGPAAVPAGSGTGK